MSGSTIIALKLFTDLLDALGKLDVLNFNALNLVKDGSNFQYG